MPDRDPKRQTSPPPLFSLGEQLRIAITHHPKNIHECRAIDGHSQQLAPKLFSEHLPCVLDVLSIMRSRILFTICLQNCWDINIPGLQLSNGINNQQQHSAQQTQKNGYEAKKVSIVSEVAQIRISKAYKI